MSRYKNKPTKVETKPLGVALNSAKKGKTVEVLIGTPELKKMNIYQKVQNIRNEIAKSDIKRSSKNTDKGFTYLELPDYLPLINKLGAEQGIMTHFEMTADMGTLKIFNTDNPSECLTWTLPVADLQMNDAEGIQVMKGKTTYMRRTLFEVAFEISVKDTVDSKTKATTIRPDDDLTQEQVDEIRATSDLDELSKVCQSIKNTKGFDKEKALLKHYSVKKEELSK